MDLLLPFGAAALLLVALDLLAMWRRAAAREVDRVRGALRLESGGAPLESARLAALPAPLRRMVEAATATGALPRDWRRLEIAMEGSFLPAPGREPMAFRATQVIVPLGGFVWEAEIGSGLATLRGADFYHDGRAAMRFWMAGILPVVQASGRDVARSAAARLLGESLLLPCGLLPERGAAWREADDPAPGAGEGEAAATTSLHLEATLHGESFAATVALDAQGRPAVVTMSRLRGRGPLGPAREAPFRAELGEWAPFGEVMLPRRLRAMWCDDPAVPFVFFDARLTSGRAA